MKKIVTLVVFVAAIAALGVPVGAQGVREPQPRPEPILAPVGQEQIGGVATVVRERPVEVDEAALDGLALGGARLLEFFDDAAFVVVFDRSHARPEAWWDLGSTWSGTVQGDAHGWFVLTVQRGVLSANLWTGDGRAFQVRLEGGGEHVAQELNLDAFEPCAGGLDPAAHGLGAPAVREERAAGCGDGGWVADIMVVYTPEARQGAGGVGAIEGITANSVAATNVAYTASLIEVELRLVHVAEVAYNDSGDMIADLIAVTDPTDGIMDYVHDWRNTYDADLVALLMANDPWYCGVAWLMYENTPEPEWLGFSVTRFDCALGGMTFAHEVGHNQGACHAPGDGGGCEEGGLFPYSLGHRFNGASGQQFRTIMAYSPGTRINHFSNPGVQYDNRATGTSGRNNARTLNETGEAISLYRPNPGAWMKEAETGPLARSSHAMAYDAARQRVVLFGGHTGTNRNDTWLWDGAAWSQAGQDAPIKPSARSSHAMAYDAARQRVILFGGSTSGGYSSETWEWDGQAWTLRTALGPAARYWHAMAYDSARQRIVMFGGGSTVGYRGDTWEWDGSFWTQVANEGPSPRMGHAMAYDPKRQRVVLFGGFDGARLGDTWEWDGTSWVEVTGEEPSPRYGHAMAYDPIRGSVQLLGGSDAESRRGDTWEWDGSAWTLRTRFGPTPRWLHAMTYEPAFQRLVVFGGNDGVRRGDTWVITSRCEPCFADCNGDGTINTLDFFCFFNLFTAGDPRADCNGDNKVNSVDFVCFLNGYNAGCP